MGIVTVSTSQFSVTVSSRKNLSIDTIPTKRLFDRNYARELLRYHLFLLLRDAKKRDEEKIFVFADSYSKDNFRIVVIEGTIDGKVIRSWRKDKSKLRCLIRERIEEKRRETWNFLSP